MYFQSILILFCHFKRQPVTALLTMHTHNIQELKFKKKKKKYLFSENLPDKKNKYLCRFYTDSFGLVLVLPNLSTVGSFPGTSYTAMPTIVFCPRPYATFSAGVL